MSDHLFDEAFDEFERELDPIDNRLDEALEEFEDDLEVGGGFYDEENDDGYFHSATKNEEAVVINRTSVPKTNNVDSNVYKGNGLSAKSGDNDANSQHGKLITTSQEETSIDLNQDSVGANMWNQKARLLKRHERKHKRHIHRERKHRIFEMAKGQAIEMKTKLVEASAEDTEAPFLELNMLSVEVHYIAALYFKQINVVCHVSEIVSVPPFPPIFDLSRSLAQGELCAVHCPRDRETASRFKATVIGSS